MSVRGTDMGGGGDSSQDFTQATQEESALGEYVSHSIRSLSVIDRRRVERL